MTDTPNPATLDELTRLTEQMAATVVKARVEGHSWNAIAGALGIEHKAIEARFGRSAERAQRDIARMRAKYAHPSTPKRSHLRAVK